MNGSSALDVVPNFVGFASRNALLTGVVVMVGVTHPKSKDLQRIKIESGNRSITHLMYSSQN